MGVTHSKQPTDDAPAGAEAPTRVNSLIERLSRGEGAAVNVEPLLRLMRCTPDHTEGVINAIEGCPALTGRLLSVINSAAFGLPRSIESVRRAVLQLGPSRARALGLAFALRALNETWKLPPALSQHLWVNSLHKACAARLACDAIDREHADDAFCTALIQDVGLAALIDADRTFYETTMGDAPGTWCAQEAEQFGIDHAEAGAVLLSAWGAPESVCDLVRKHHEPPTADGAAAVRMCAYVSSLIPHFGEPASGHEREWLAALFGQLLAQHHASPDAFLDAAADAARQIHGNAKPTTVSASIVTRLTQIVCADTTALVSHLCQLEDSLGQVQKQTQSLRFAACTDPLTGVLNRRGFFELGERRVAMVAQQGKSALMLAIDLDNFKQVNDTLGHDGGDSLLRQLAQRLRESLDREDLIARIGGDEFVVLIVDVNEDRARAITQRLNERCNGAHCRIDDRRSVALRFSLGALYCDRLPDGVGLETLITAADEAMYRRKRNGKAGYVFVHYPPDADCQPRPAA